MSVSTCLSSKVMSQLLVWRNPQGREEGWMNQGQGINNYKLHVSKIIFTEACLIGLLITTTVESVAYVALRSVSIIFYPVTTAPYTFFAKLLESSSFTILWAAADILLYNPLAVNVMTQEPFARYWAEWLTPHLLSYFVKKIRCYLMIGITILQNK